MSKTLQEPFEFLDANCLLGTWGSAPARAFSNLPSLRGALERIGIRGALCSHAAALHYDAATGNGLLLRELSGQAGLFACVVCAPDLGLEGPSAAAAQIAAWKSAGACAVRFLPKRCGALKDPLHRPFLAALADASLPLILDFELGHWSSQMRELDWEGLTWVLGEFSALPVVLLRVGQGVDRSLFSLLGRHPHVHLEISYYTGAGALERLCARFGPRRCLFGTGMPIYDPGPAITLITYSGLDDEAKRRVAGRNLKELLLQSRK